MRLRTDSLRFRLIAGSAVIFLLDVIVVFLIASTLFESYAKDQFREEMAIYADQLAEELRYDARGQPGLKQIPPTAAFIDEKAVVLWEIHRDGFQPLRSASLKGRRLHQLLLPHHVLAQGKWEREVDGIFEYERTYPSPDGGTPTAVIVAVDSAALSKVIEKFERATLILFSVVGVVTLLVWILMIGYGLRPFNAIRRAVAQVRNGEADQLTGRFPAEVTPLIDDFNRLLAENHAMLQRARTKAGNLAHGLRTPLAIIYDEAERIGKAGLVERSESLLHAGNAIRRRIEYHLARARSVLPAASIGQTSSVRKGVERIFDAMAKLHAGRPVALRIETPGDVKVHCDPLDMSEILANLIDNGCKWAVNEVVVAWRQVGDRVEISVDDDGIGIPADKREQVLIVGERLDDTVSGTGLGLAIANELCIIHEGEMELGDSPLGGLRVTVRLPVLGDQRGIR